MKSQYLWGHYFWRNYCSCSLSKSQVVKLLGRICFLCKLHQHRSNFQRRLLQTLQTTYLQKGEWNIFCDGNVGDLNSYQNITMRKHGRFVFSRHAARCGIRIEKGLGWSCSISSSFFESSFNLSLGQKQWKNFKHYYLVFSYPISTVCQNLALRILLLRKTLPLPVRALSISRHFRGARECSSWFQSVSVTAAMNVVHEDTTCPKKRDGKNRNYMEVPV